MTPTSHGIVMKRHHVEGVRKQALGIGRSRLLLTGLVLAIGFAGIASRLVDLTIFNSVSEPRSVKFAAALEPTTGRANILDRNGMILAASLPTVSLSVDPAKIIDIEEAVDGLESVFPKKNRKEITARLRAKGRFTWLARNLTPKQHQDVNSLGIPGLAFHRGERRVYPNGRLVSHVIGITDIDGHGIAGVENHFDQSLRSSGKSLQLSIDLRAQSILREELAIAMAEFKSVGAAGLVMDVQSSEIIAMVSLPDFDPNRPAKMSNFAGFNRATKGVYEMGSTFKLFTAAMALDSGTISMSDGYDASEPLRVSRFTIRDFHAKNRWLSVPEIILHSSNIGAAKMAVDVGSKVQRAYLGKFGMLEPAGLEIPEVGAPLTPPIWRPINTMTISYGHGISVTPVQVITGISALVNGGVYRRPTLLKQHGKLDQGERIITKATSDKIRALMRLVVSEGTGRKANIPGFLIGGKTGTAEKISRRGYSEFAKIVSFVGAFPMNAPRYAVLAIVDEPIGNKRTFNYATGGWVAAPTVGKIIERVGPILGIAPDPNASVDLKSIIGAKGYRKVLPKPRKASWEETVALAVGSQARNRIVNKELDLKHVRRSVRRGVPKNSLQKAQVPKKLSPLER